MMPSLSLFLDGPPSSQPAHSHANMLPGRNRISSGSVGIQGGEEELHIIVEIDSRVK